MDQSDGCPAKRMITTICRSRGVAPPLATGPEPVVDINKASVMQWSTRWCTSTTTPKCTDFLLNKNLQRKNGKSVKLDETWLWRMRRGTSWTRTWSPSATWCLPTSTSQEDGDATSSQAWPSNQLGADETCSTTRSQRTAHQHGQGLSMWDLWTSSTSQWSIPVSSVPTATTFNDRIQADTLWVMIPRRARAIPVLMISDVTTRLVAGRVLMTESSSEFIKAVERGWIRHFGPMKRLCVDEHRAWSSEAIRHWCAELSWAHGEPRRVAHQICHHWEGGQKGKGCLILALNYVIPQVNRMPNVSGYSLIQWTLGYTPHVPGLLIKENVEMNRSQLDPTAAFRDAVNKANIDSRLLRALLRKRTALQSILTTGDRCYYSRAGTAAGSKLWWKGPAIVVMREVSGADADI